MSPIYNPISSSSGSVSASSITGTLSVAQGGTGASNTTDIFTNLGMAASVYTPTLTNVANLDGSVTSEFQYIRTGSIVTVSGAVEVNPTLTATSTKLGISLPVASNIGATEDCSGTAFCPAIAAQGAAIIGDATNDRAQMQWIASDVTVQSMFITFQYQII